MKFTTNAGALREAMTTARHVTPGGTAALVAYTGLLLTVKGKTLAVRGSDGDTTITTTAEITDGADGHVLLNPKPIMAYLGTLPPSADVTVSSDEPTAVTVVAGGAHPYEFKAMAATFPDTGNTKVLFAAADLSDLAAGLASVKHAADKELGVQLVSTDTDLVLHSTDTFRLARAVLPKAGFGTFSGSLPLPVLDRMARSGAVQVGIDSRANKLVLAGPNVTVSAALLAAPFPMVEVVLNNKRPHKVDVPLDDLRSAVARLSSVAEDCPLTCKIDGELLTLEVRNNDLGAGNETIVLPTPATTSGEFILKVNYLADAAAAHGNDVDLVSVEWSSAAAPVVFVSGGDLPVTCVVQPQRAI